MGSFHGLMEVCGEGGPVGAIRFKVGDIGREFHSGQCVMVLAFVAAVMTVGSDQTRAHNLWKTLRLAGLRTSTQAGISEGAQQAQQLCVLGIRYSPQKVHNKHSN